MKKIIACILSIAVLFAFAACEASTPVSYYGKNVDSITLLSAPDYVQGETLNPADLSFRVVYNNGETATRNGAELGLAPTTGTVGTDLEISTSGDYVLSSTNIFGIAYGTTRPGTDGKYTVKDVWPVEIKAADPTQLTYVVDPTNAAKEIKKGASTLSAEDIKGIVVTAKFDNGNTKVVSATIANIDEDDFTVDASGTAESTTTVKSANPKVTIDPTWTLTIKEETNNVTALKLVFGEQEIFKESKEGHRNLLSSIKYDVVASYENGPDKVVAKYNGSTLAPVTGGESVSVDFTEVYAANTYVQDRTSLVYAAVVTYEGITKNTNLEIEYTPDYPENVEVTAKDVNRKYFDNQSIELSDFNYSGTNWKSGNTAAAPVDEENFVIENSKILFGEQAAGTTHPFTIKWKNTDQSVAIKVAGASAADGKGTVNLAPLS